MNTSARGDVLREAYPAKEHSRGPSADAAPQKGSVRDPSQPRGPAGPHVPGGGAVQTFMDGDGI
jgi:hypothetical protein